MSDWVSRPSWGDRREWSPRKKGKKQKLFLVLSPRPGQAGQNTSGWYRRLREPISPLSLLNCDQLWKLFSRVWTILLVTVIYDLDCRITAKYSKCQTSFYSMHVSFRFHSLRCSEILVSASICTKIRTCRFHRTEEFSNNFSVSWHITHISMAISANLGRDTDHNSIKLVCAHPLGDSTFRKFATSCPWGTHEWKRVKASVVHGNCTIWRV